MDTINIRSLHIKTGESVRKAAEGHTLIVTDRGTPVAADSSEYISEDRD
jgi:prevent-host-death family protein